MLKTLSRKFVVLALAAAPLGTGSYVALTATTGLGAAAAHAASNQCIGVPTGPEAGGSVATNPCENGNTPTDLAQINVCLPGNGNTGTYPNSGSDGSTDSGVPAPTTGLNTGPDVGVYEPASGVSVWASTVGPSGQAEIDGIGIASEETGC